MLRSDIRLLDPPKCWVRHPVSNPRYGSPCLATWRGKTLEVGVLGIGRRTRALALGTAVVAAFGMVAASPALGAVKAKDVASGPTPAEPTVVASGLNNPRKLAVGPDGTVYVTEAGVGGNSGNCITSPEGGTACYGPSGSITRIARGAQTRVLTGLPSAADQTTGMAADGPSAVLIDGDGTLGVLNQDLGLNPDGTNGFGADGALFGKLLAARPGSDSSTWETLADFAKFEAENNPDKGAGAQPGEEIDSDPYAMVRFGPGLAVADAAANDLLYLDEKGDISVLAVFPTQPGVIPADAFGPGNPPADTPVDIQSVPTSVAVGPDGALYVGELTGFPFVPGTARVWRVVPGQAPTVYASGFTNIVDLAFDRQGHLLVLEIAKNGLNSNDPTGALIRVESDGTRTELMSDGLVAPTGLAVAVDGSVYVSNFGVFPGDAAPAPQPTTARIADGPLRGAAVSAPKAPAGPPMGEVVRIPVAQTNPYRFVATDGGVFTFGDTGFYGSTGNINLNEPIVAMSSNPLRPGYWLAAADGGIFSFGDADFYGSTGDIDLNSPIVGMAATPDGRGYWLVAEDGGIFAFGDAMFFGSTGAMTLNEPIVGMAATPDGGGYWLVAADGGIFAFGDAQFFGSTGNIALNEPIVGMSATPDGGGYWMVATDGGIFAFGDAGFFGSTGAMTLNEPIVSMTATTDGKGYTLVAADGGVFNFGNSTFHGSTGNIRLNEPIVGSDVG